MQELQPIKIYSLTPADNLDMRLEFYLYACHGDKSFGKQEETLLL